MSKFLKSDTEICFPNLRKDEVPLFPYPCVSTVNNTEKYTNPFSGRFPTSLLIAISTRLCKECMVSNFQLPKSFNFQFSAKVFFLLVFASIVFNRKGIENLYWQRQYWPNYLKVSPSMVFMILHVLMTRK